ncbi:PilT/PilU family type 4a pilus ATPase [Vibrio sp. ZSDZ34]|uniref:PilT/PilU family type 4a pilus ATPase n=2 Tax=Vibrio gelatinilyticus TaxID=2893468 RepID=A0A9X2AX83_9VIBR|nr:PilT/PilU family type 4a pilus ATPase [Vibrio gelatinilyticus]MCJ2378071.1 PilT/PilU family type 4a pilus ATPase [Vibrio gelatinilyticus]
MKLNDLLKNMVETKASDLYLTVDASPLFRIDGELKQNQQRLSHTDILTLLSQMLGESELEAFKRTKEANFAIANQYGRFRVSAFYQRELATAVVRRIESQIPTFETLGLPDVLQDLSIAKRGLVLIVGATGSGKSSTLAAMVGYRNEHRTGHILTVEDPIEFVHQHKKCLISQREIGLDTESYSVALKNSLRQAPDVIVIGEIRTRETMEYALQFAETGHLCMATLHANNAHQALERILHLIPEDQKKQLLFDLSNNLRGVLGQQLVRKREGKGRHGVFEVLLNSPRVSELIQRGELHKIKQTMASSKDVGMQTFDQALYTLVTAEKISESDALSCADSANDLRIMLKRNQPTECQKSSSLANIKIDMN